MKNPYLCVQLSYLGGTLDPRLDLTKGKAKGHQNNARLLIPFRTEQCFFRAWFFQKEHPYNFGKLSCLNL
jgi:hypothetical protein